MNAYRRRIYSILCDLLQPYTPLGNTLDFGAGDGCFARSMSAEKLAAPVVAVDVMQRKENPDQVILYDGKTLPFDDQSFDLVYSIDVLHHCTDPAASLAEALRCTRRFFLINDHTFSNWRERMTLAALDEIGNRRFGVPSPYNYQRDWSWFAILEKNGFVLKKLIHPACCHTGVLGWATNSLQFIALWQRAVANG